MSQSGDPDRVSSAGAQMSPAAAGAALGIRGEELERDAVINPARAHDRKEDR